MKQLDMRGIKWTKDHHTWKFQVRQNFFSIPKTSVIITIALKIPLNHPKWLSIASMLGCFSLGGPSFYTEQSFLHRAKCVHKWFVYSLSAQNKTVAQKFIQSFQACYCCTPFDINIKFGLIYYSTRLLILDIQYHVLGGVPWDWVNFYWKTKSWGHLTS